MAMLHRRTPLTPIAVLRWTACEAWWTLCTDLDFMNRSIAAVWA